jgi:hypothetical protein
MSRQYNERVGLGLTKAKIPIKVPWVCIENNAGFEIWIYCTVTLTSVGLGGVCRLLHEKVDVGGYLAIHGKIRADINLAKKREQWRGCRQ